MGVFASLALLACTHHGVQAAVPPGPTPAATPETSADAGVCLSRQDDGFVMRVTSSGGGQSMPALKCPLPGVDQAWFLDEGRPWASPVTPVDGVGCVHVASGSGRGTWLFEDQEALAVQWTGAAPGTDLPCDGLAPAGFTAAVVTGHVALPPTVDGLCDAKVFGCGAGSCVQTDGSFRFAVPPGSCALRVEASDGVYRFKGAPVPTQPQPDQQVSVELGLDPEPVQGIGVMLAQRDAASRSRA